MAVVAGSPGEEPRGRAAFLLLLAETPILNNGFSLQLALTGGSVFRPTKHTHTHRMLRGYAQSTDKRRVPADGYSIF